MAVLDKFPRLQKTYHFLWAWAGARVHRNPSKKIFTIGITGTKGKTTTLELLNAILETAGKRTALLSSLRVKVAEETEKNPTGNTMPGRAYIQAFLARAVKAKCDYALIEVASQGVTQHRHLFIDWSIGVLTNLAPEHIESHGSFENYRAAKLEFLRYVLRRGGQVFLNRDDAHFPFFENALSGTDPAYSSKEVFYSKEDDEVLYYTRKLEAPNFARRESAPRFMLSDFNKENIAVAVAIAKHLGVGDKTIEGALGTFRGVPGRMEFLTKGSYTAIVDYAHTPESLAAAYAAARPKENANYEDTRLICVLGAAGGGRDKWKRKEFGKIAAEYCDEIILTDEDPYDEDPALIIQEIRAGIEEREPGRSGVYAVLDRREAIQKAVSLMQEGDVVIGTGKGSEEWIHVAHGEKIPWNERAVFEEALAGK
jgi:UDP-N-acetylmuramoyl-L-alanyl-D-glutamate--2,6-diaminopimelate ligase